VNLIFGDFMNKLHALFLLVLSLVVVPFSSHAQENELEFSLKPYIWFPFIDGDITFGDTPVGSSGTPRVSAGPADIFANLNYGILLGSELRKNKWSLFSDFVYLNLSAESSRVDAIDFGGTIVSAGVDTGTEVDFQQFLTTMVGGYQVIDDDNHQMDLISGFRYLWVEAELDWSLAAAVIGPLGGGQTFARTGTLEEDKHVWNGVGGVRGKVRLWDSNWYIPYHADIGAGESDLTWQVFSALGYSWEKWDVVLGYRHLVFDAGDDSLIDNISISGPILGASYKF
jgi:hypothetical protein